MFFLFGREVCYTGLASYFKEFAWKNTILTDFVGHIDKAVKEAKVDVGLDMVDWSTTWLMKAGCNIISHDVTEENGKITKFIVNQKCVEHGEGNLLRVQKY